MRATLWPDKQPSEKRTATFDFKDELGAGESVSSASVTVVLLSGTDATPAALLNGAQQVATPQVLQGLKDGVAGCNYGLLCLATKNTGEIIAAAALLPVREAW
jgi:hypothetical protein